MQHGNNVDPKDLELQLRSIFSQYKESFTDKTYNDENNDSDVLMEIFGITPELKRENRQYWGRELGMCWQLLISKLAESKCADFQPALKMDADEPTDLFIGNDAIDTKYRIGSGDSGTLKKFKKYGALLKEQGYRPVLLILRKDNLPAAITACKVGGWEILTADETFRYLKEKTGFDFLEFLKKLKGEFDVKRGT
jgi:hypothetical protein